MSLDFAIIPFDDTFISCANDIKFRLNENNNLQMNVIIDTNYSKPISSRINKWKKEEFDVIIIDQEYTETGVIIARFYDKGSRAQTMTVDEFIDLVHSYDDDDKEDEDQNGGCIIL